MPVQTRSAGRTELARDEARSNKKADGENVKPEKTRNLKATSDKAKAAKAKQGNRKVDKVKQNGAKSDKAKPGNSKTSKAKADNPKKTNKRKVEDKNSELQGPKSKKTKAQKSKAGKSKSDKPKPQKSKSVAKPAPRPLDFSHHYDNAHDEMYVNHERLRESQKWEAAFDVASDIEGSLKAIAAQTKAHSPYETKFSAIDTIRAIFALLDSVGEIPKVVGQNIYGWGDYLMSVLGTFGEDELDQLYEEKDARAKEGGRWIDLFGEMVDLTDDYGLTDDLRTGEAWELLIGGEQEEWGGEEQDEDDVQSGEENEMQDDGEEWEGFDD
ncbi:hypothetical protein GE09DRAFT_577820 [Coniochaeta sp. 2T2.1]|nr:hypothetical protein GE09DRAFT_577820 [Coniochaeta sp. 2T2.1]